MCYVCAVISFYMREESDFFYGDEEAMEAVRKFEDSLRSRKSLFLDIVDFESVIDYYINADDYKKAQEAVGAALNIYPNSVEVQVRKAEVLIMGKRFSEALDLLKQLVKFDSSNGEIYLLLGQTSLEMMNADAAKKYFSKAIDLTPTDKSGLYYRIAGLYQYSENYHEALRYLGMAFEMSPESLNIIFDLAYGYEQIDDLDNAELFYNKYLDINPFSSNVWYNLGILYTYKDNLEKAIEAFDFAIAVDPNNSSAYFNKANTLANNESYIAAVSCFKELTKLEPENPKIYCSIGECYEKMKDYDNALKAYRKSISLNPATAEAYYGIGVVMLETKQYNMALDLINKARALDPDNYDFWLGFAKVKYELNNADEAIDAYHQAISLNPEEPDAYLGIAEILLYQNRLDDVELFYNRIALKFPDIPMLKVIRAAALYKSNKPTEALDTLRMAKMIDPLSVTDFLSIVTAEKDIDFLQKVSTL